MAQYRRKESMAIPPNKLHPLSRGLWTLTSKKDVVRKGCDKAKTKKTTSFHAVHVARFTLDNLKR